MPGPLFKVKSKKDFISKLRKHYGYTREQARVIVEAAWEGPGYYYHRGGDYFVRFSRERDLARGGSIGRGRWRHTFDPVIQVAKRLTEEAVRAAEAVSRRVEEKVQKPVRAEAVLKAAFPRRPKLPSEVKRMADFVWDELSPSVKRAGNWTYITVLNIIRMLYDYAKSQGFDMQNIDLLHDFDWAQGYHYVKGEIMRKIMNAVADKYAGITDDDVKAMMAAWEADIRLREEEGYIRTYDEYIPELPEIY
ncbi:MAG: hypothetical protein DRJ18_01770 [Candidatus Methanomethylicota archaeon]|nr:MAG: hypothetical protein DRJ18_01770 [Candidatus Verstraetearchaeota archaeon]